MLISTQTSHIAIYVQYLKLLSNTVPKYTYRTSFFIIRIEQSTTYWKIKNQTIRTAKSEQKNKTE